MFNIVFYRDEKGHEPAREFIQELERFPKLNRQRLRKINLYLAELEQFGLALGKPQIDSIKTQENLYELRPGGDRIFFCCIMKTTFVLLHGFVKKTQKTPPNEIERACRERDAVLRKEYPND